MMRIRLARHMALALAVLFTVGFCLVDTGAQQRRRKRSRRITNPVVSSAPSTQPDTSQTAVPEPKIISTAEEQVNDPSGEPVAGGTRRNNRTRAADSEQDTMRRTVNKLSTQVNQLTDKLGHMEEQQRTLVNLERLTRAEQRAESLRAQLRDVQAKEAELGARADQLDEALKPENIERAVSVYGTTRPEEAREQRRRQLENERARVRTQLDQLATGRTRLESSIANADAEADRIRQLVDAATTTPAPTTDSGTTNNTGGQSSTTTTGTTQTSPSTSGSSTQGSSTPGSSTSGPPL